MSHRNTTVNNCRWGQFWPISCSLNTGATWMVSMDGSRAQTTKLRSTALLCIKTCSCCIYTFCILLQLWIYHGLFAQLNWYRIPLLLINGRWSSHWARTIEITAGTERPPFTKNAQSLQNPTLKQSALKFMFITQVISCRRIWKK